ATLSPQARTWYLTAARSRPDRSRSLPRLHAHARRAVHDVGQARRVGRRSCLIKRPVHSSPIHLPPSGRSAGGECDSPRSTPGFGGEGRGAFSYPRLAALTVPTRRLRPTKKSGSILPKFLAVFA